MINHLTPSEFIKYLEIHAKTDTEKKALKVIIELEENGNSFGDEVRELELQIDSIEDERDEAVRKVDLLERKLEEILRICKN